MRVFDYSGTWAKPVRTYLPFSATSKGGVSLDVARIDGDAIPDIIVGTGRGGGSTVEIFNGRNGTRLSRSVAYSPAEGNQTPVRVAALDLNGDGLADRVVTAQGAGGRSRLIRSFAPLSGQQVDEFFESHADFSGAYFLADY